MSAAPAAARSAGPPACATAPRAIADGAARRPAVVGPPLSLRLAGVAGAIGGTPAARSAGSRRATAGQVGALHLPPVGSPAALLPPRPDRPTPLRTTIPEPSSQRPAAHRVLVRVGRSSRAGRCSRAPSTIGPPLRYGPITLPRASQPFPHGHHGSAWAHRPRHSPRVLRSGETRRAPVAAPLAAASAAPAPD